VASGVAVNGDGGSGAAERDGTTLTGVAQGKSRRLTESDDNAVGRDSAGCDANGGVAIVQRGRAEVNDVGGGDGRVGSGTGSRSNGAPKCTDTPAAGGDPPVLPSESQ